MKAFHFFKVINYGYNDDTNISKNTCEVIINL